MSRKIKLPRRNFLALTTAAVAEPLARMSAQTGSRPPAIDSPGPALRLAGLSLPELRKRYQAELFAAYLPFWDRYGIDHKYGGFMCALDHDGTLVNDYKFHWFQGRGIWVYSFLYNYFDKNPRYLDIAKKTKDFMLAHFPQNDGTWAELVSREGKMLKPFSGDLFGMFFAAEGLQEYAYASGDGEAREMAFGLMKQLFAKLKDPAVPDPETGIMGVRSQGVWMVTVRTATQMLRRWPNPEIAAMADQSVDAVIHKHYNPEFGLDTETLNLDNSRPKETANITVCGHSVETLWMIMDEALRRQDQTLYDLCAGRLRHHLDVGWDHIFGGLADSINVNQGAYQWPVDTPVGTNYQFREVGEYKWVKTSWSFDEVLISTMNVIEHQGSEWAVRYFDLAQDTFDKKMSLHAHGLPLFMGFAERPMAFQPHVVRQENYHHARQLMLNLLALDRMIKREESMGKTG
ncbi:MAG: AGE family epimerase/isomerase [Terriglobia bacterium]|jgi:mannose/cellobiose epimerase-like protein (N-acyl-D-glucosamine 2-epimerase family)